MLLLISLLAADSVYSGPLEISHHTLQVCMCKRYTNSNIGKEVLLSINVACANSLPTRNDLKIDHLTSRRLLVWYNASFKASKRSLGHGRDRRSV